MINGYVHSRSIWSMVSTTRATMPMTRTSRENRLKMWPLMHSGVASRVNVVVR